MSAGDFQGAFLVRNFYAVEQILFYTLEVCCVYALLKSVALPHYLPLQPVAICTPSTDSGECQNAIHHGAVKDDKIVVLNRFASAGLS